MKKRTHFENKLGIVKNSSRHSSGTVGALHSEGTACTAVFRNLSPSDVSPDGKGRVNIHILEIGEFPNTAEMPDGTTLEVITVINADVLRKVSENFPAELLLDYEHFSMDADKSSEASGWAYTIQNTASNTGLEMGTEWTPEAATKIKNKTYKYISPVLVGKVTNENGKNYLYPDRLISAGLTNVPNMTTLKAVTANKQTTKPTIVTMQHRDILCSILGVATSVTDDQLSAAATAFVANSATNSSRITALEAENNTLKAEQLAADLVKYKNIPGDDADKTSLLSANRATVVKLWDAQLAAEPAKKHGDPLFSKNKATAPEKNYSDESDDESPELKAKFRAVQARASERSKKEKIPYNQAFNEEKAKEGI